MIEVFPKKINEEKVQASLQKLVAAFLSVAEDLVNEDDAVVQIKDSARIPANL